MLGSTVKTLHAGFSSSAPKLGPAPTAPASPVGTKLFRTFNANRNGLGAKAARPVCIAQLVSNDAVVVTFDAGSPELNDAGYIAGIIFIVLGTLFVIAVVVMSIAACDEDEDDDAALGGGVLLVCLLLFLIVGLPLFATQLDECTSRLSAPNSGNKICGERLGMFGKCVDKVFDYDCMCQEGFRQVQTRTHQLSENTCCGNGHFLNFILSEKECHAAFLQQLPNPTALWLWLNDPTLCPPSPCDAPSAGCCVYLDRNQLAALIAVDDLFATAPPSVLAPNSSSAGDFGPMTAANVTASHQIEASTIAPLLRQGLLTLPNPRALCRDSSAKREMCAPVSRVKNGPSSEENSNQMLLAEDRLGRDDQAGCKDRGGVPINGKCLYLCSNWGNSLVREVHYEYVCDGWVDCTDGSDESVGCRRTRSLPDTYDGFEESDSNPLYRPPRALALNVEYGVSPSGGCRTPIQTGYGCELAIGTTTGVWSGLISDAGLPYGCILDRSEPDSMPHRRVFNNVGNGQFNLDFSAVCTTKVSYNTSVAPLDDASYVEGSANLAEKAEADGAISGIVLVTVIFVALAVVAALFGIDSEDGLRPLAAYLCGCLLFWLVVALPLLATQLDECHSTMSSPNRGNLVCMQELGPNGRCFDKHFGYDCGCASGFRKAEGSQRAYAISQDSCCGSGHYYGYVQSREECEAAFHSQRAAEGTGWTWEADPAKCPSQPCAAPSTGCCLWTVTAAPSSFGASHLLPEARALCRDSNVAGEKAACVPDTGRGKDSDVTRSVLDEVDATSKAGENHREVIVDYTTAADRTVCRTNIATPTDCKIASLQGLFFIAGAWEGGSCGPDPSICTVYPRGCFSLDGKVYFNPFGTGLSGTLGAVSICINTITPGPETISGSSWLLESADLEDEQALVASLATIFTLLFFVGLVAAAARAWRENENFWEVLLSIGLYLLAVLVLCLLIVLPVVATQVDECTSTYTRPKHSGNAVCHKEYGDNAQCVDKAFGFDCECNDGYVKEKRSSYVAAPDTCCGTGRILGYVQDETECSNAATNLIDRDWRQRVRTETVQEDILPNREGTEFWTATVQWLPKEACPAAPCLPPGDGCCLLIDDLYSTGRAGSSAPRAICKDGTFPKDKEFCVKRRDECHLGIAKDAGCDPKIQGCIDTPGSYQCIERETEFTNFWQCKGSSSEFTIAAIPLASRCDGFIDCADGSDESFEECSDINSKDACSVEESPCNDEDDDLVRICKDDPAENAGSGRRDRKCYCVVGTGDGFDDTNTFKGGLTRDGRLAISAECPDAQYRSDAGTERTSSNKFYSITAPVIVLIFCGTFVHYYLALDKHRDNIESQHNRDEGKYQGGLFGWISGSIGFPALLLASRIAFRSFDLASDWGFFSINIVQSTRFRDVYTDENNERAFDAYYDGILACNILGTGALLLEYTALIARHYWANPGIIGDIDYKTGAWCQKQKLDDKEIDDDVLEFRKRRAAKLVLISAVLVFSMEDLPQLVLQGVYIQYMRNAPGGVDDFAIVSMAMSVAGVLMTLYSASSYVIQEAANKSWAFIYKRALDRERDARVEARQKEFVEKKTACSRRALSADFDHDDWGKQVELAVDPAFPADNYVNGTTVNGKLVWCGEHAMSRLLCVGVEIDQAELTKVEEVQTEYQKQSFCFPFNEADKELKRAVNFNRDGYEALEHLCKDAERYVLPAEARRELELARQSTFKDEKERERRNRVMDAIKKAIAVIADERRRVPGFLELHKGAPCRDDLAEPTCFGVLNTGVGWTFDDWAMWEEETTKKMLTYMDKNEGRGERWHIPAALIVPTELVFRPTPHGSSGSVLKRLDPKLLRLDVVGNQQSAFPQDLKDIQEIRDLLITKREPSASKRYSNDEDYAPFESPKTKLLDKTVKLDPVMMTDDNALMKDPAGMVECNLLLHDRDPIDGRPICAVIPTEVEGGGWETDKNKKYLWAMEKRQKGQFKKHKYFNQDSKRSEPACLIRPLDPSFVRLCCQNPPDEPFTFWDIDGAIDTGVSYVYVIGPEYELASSRQWGQRFSADDGFSTMVRSKDLKKFSLGSRNDRTRKQGNLLKQAEKNFIAEREERGRIAEALKKRIRNANINGHLTKEQILRLDREIDGENGFRVNEKIDEQTMPVGAIAKIRTVLHGDGATYLGVEFLKTPLGDREATKDLNKHLTGNASDHYNNSVVRKKSSAYEEEVKREKYNKIWAEVAREFEKDTGLKVHIPLFGKYFEENISRRIEYFEEQKIPITSEMTDEISTEIFDFEIYGTNQTHTKLVYDNESNTRGRGELLLKQVDGYPGAIVNAKYCVRWVNPRLIQTAFRIAKGRYQGNEAAKRKAFDDAIVGKGGYCNQHRLCRGRGQIPEAAFKDGTVAEIDSKTAHARCGRQVDDPNQAYCAGHRCSFRANNERCPLGRQFYVDKNGTPGWFPFCRNHTMIADQVSIVGDSKWR